MLKRTQALLFPVLLLMVDRIGKLIIHERHLNTRLAGIEIGSDFAFVFIGCTLLILVTAWVRSGFPIALGFIIAGGISNLFDRFLFGGVIDNFSIGSFYFNLADISIWIGCALLLRSLIHRDKIHRASQG